MPRSRCTLPAVARTSERGATARVLAAALAACVCGCVGVPVASAETVTLGLGGWQVQSSALVTQQGGQISQPGYPASSWLAVKPDDAGAVGTEINALLQNGACPNVFFSEEMKSCFGYMDAIGRDTVAQFAVPWWFRTNSNQACKPAKHAQLIVNGVVGQADLWVNGHEVATQATLQGDYTSYTFDITSLIHPGANSLALEVYPNDPTRMFTLDDVDWNQIPPGQQHRHPVPGAAAHVGRAGDRRRARARGQRPRPLQLGAHAQGRSDQQHCERPQSGTVSATVTPPAGGGEADHAVSKPVIAGGARERTSVSFTAAEDPAADDRPPAAVVALPDGRPAAVRACDERLAARRRRPDSQAGDVRHPHGHLVSDGASPIAPHGVRQFAINGQPFVLRGGGWAEDLFLRYSAAEHRRPDRPDQEPRPQRDPHRGQADAGRLLRADGPGGHPDRRRLPVLRRLAARTHASSATQDYQRAVLPRRWRSASSCATTRACSNFSWSDNAPTRKQEAVSLKGFAQADFQDPLIASAEYNEHARARALGREGGPLRLGAAELLVRQHALRQARPDAHQRRRRVGLRQRGERRRHGADARLDRTLHVAVRTGTAVAGPGLQPVPHQLRARTAGAEATAATRSARCTSSTRRSPRASARWSSLDEYVEDAQVQNYETQRAQFEAYIDHCRRQARRPRPASSTGS